MKFKKRSAAAVALAAVMAGGVLVGCDSLTTTDASKDYAQVVAEVNISKSEKFAEGGDYAAYKDVISNAEITKRDMVMLFVSSYATMAQYGYSYRDIFNAIADSLVNRQIYVQYAMIYFFENNSALKVEDYLATVAAAKEAAKEAGYTATKVELEAKIAGLGFFLDEDEKDKAIYSLRSSFNDALDSQEEKVINAEEDDHDHDHSIRTTPTGVNTEDEDYYTNNYYIYTGTGSRTAADCGEYETIERSTPMTRRQAYSSYLNNLRSNSLLLRGEDTSEFENLVYYSMQKKTAYEGALLTKLSDAFEEEAEALINATDWATTQFNSKLTDQIEGYKDDTSSFETLLNGMSDSSFVLAAPLANYGFVINILLPFSTAQSQYFSSDTAIDSGDAKGNKFLQRASVLKDVKATDQRNTWFTGHDDYSFLAGTEDGAYKGTLDNKEDRNYLFFQDCLGNAEGATGTQYTALKNYYGKYTYNGKVTPKEENGHTHYTFTPKKIDIDDFIGEMEGYLGVAGLNFDAAKKVDNRSGYYTQKNYYDENGKVDYSKFIYYQGKVQFTDGFNANEMFLRGSEENNAFSVVNELSFAYNTDTAGLNTYLGYAVTPEKTSFVPEFEYAAQEACKGGAGTYVVVPSDYGWHIIYCTFSFTSAGETPFKYNPAESAKEGTFSYLFYEALKAQNVSNYASTKQTEIINSFAESCSTIYKSRFEDLASIG